MYESINEGYINFPSRFTTTVLLGIVTFLPEAITFPCLISRVALFILFVGETNNVALVKAVYCALFSFTPSFLGKYSCEIPICEIQRANNSSMFFFIALKIYCFFFLKIPIYGIQKGMCGC